MDSGISAYLESDSHVVAALNYIERTARKPFTYAGTPPAGQPQRFAPLAARKVMIQDGRPLAARFSLDREGFQIRRHRTAVEDLYDEAAITARYHPEMQRLVTEETGASRVVVFDHTIRTASLTRPDGSPAREPVHRVHNDYTDKSAPQRVRDLLPDEADELLGRRYAFINVWRPITGPLEHLPLALCDAGSLDRDDIVPSDLIYPDRVGETYAIRYNPRHRWFYFPRMTREEVVLIKCYDSDPARARFSAHTAFEDPRTPANPLPRESIEIRTIAFFD